MREQRQRLVEQLMTDRADVDHRDRLRGFAAAPANVGVAAEDKLCHHGSDDACRNIAPDGAIKQLTHSKHTELFGNQHLVHRLEPSTSTPAAGQPTAGARVSPSTPGEVPRDV